MEVIRLVIGIFLYGLAATLIIGGTIEVFKGTFRLFGFLMDRIAPRLARLHTRTVRPMFVFFPEPRIRLLDEFGNRVLWIGMGMRPNPKEAYLVVLHEGFAYLMDVNGKYYEPAADLVPYLNYARQTFGAGTRENAGVRR